MARYSMDRSTPPLFKQGFSPLVKLLLSLVCSVFLLLFDPRFHILVTLRETVNTLLYPLQEGSARSYRAMQYFITYIASINSLNENNEALHTRIADLEQKSLRNDQLQEENMRLRTLLGLQQAQASHIIPSDVLYETRDAYSQKILISQGEQKKLRLSMPVIDERGVIGQITRLFPLQAEVTLLTDKELSVPVQILRTGLRTLTSGATKPGYIELRFVAAGADIQIGDVLVTSGLDGVYPSGLPVATVINVQHKANNQFAWVLCAPIAKISHYRQILALDYDSQFPPLPTETVEKTMRDRKGRLIHLPSSSR